MSSNIVIVANKKNTIGKRKPKNIINNDDNIIVQTKFDNIYNDIIKIRKNINKLQKEEKILLNKLSNIHKREVKKNMIKKNKKRHPIGWEARKKVNGKFAEWLDVEDGSLLTGPEISKKFWSKIKELNLQGDDKRVFRTNDEISEIFGVPASVNNSNNPNDVNGFNFRTYQKYIKYALENNN